MTIAELHRQFLNPGNAYRGKPFWSWNGLLERGELLRQIGVLRDMGMGGFFMHSRTGLVTEYLGEEWFAHINACADEAERLGMEAWLYDEDRWPSGTAGGAVTRDPAFRMRFVQMRIEPAESHAPREGDLATFACQLDGLAFADLTRLREGAPPPPGRSVLVFRIVEMAPDTFYNGYTYVDTMNRAATERFIALTHERYREECGDRLGRSIKGIFTDEPHRGALMDPFGSPHMDCEHQVPWTGDLPERFRERFGYDLLERLPELFLQPGGRRVSQVKWHYVELLQELFLDRFLRPIDGWCREHGVVLTGHVLHEDSLAAQTAMCGSVMRCYEHMGWPGIDLLTEGNRGYWVAKQLQSVARQIGRRWLLSELYGCTGWQMSFEAHKAVGDWQALFGVNVRCPHLSWYTMEGEAKRDYPASIFHQSAWWKDYRHVETYFARMGLAMSQGEARCDILVLDPVESMWCQVHPGWARFLGAVDPELQELERGYAELFHWLQGAQLDFDYGNEEMLGRLGSAVRDSEGRAVLRVGRASYHTVLVGRMATIRSSTLRLLAEHLAAGGAVLFAGDPPAHVDALESGEAAALARPAVRVPWNREHVVVACREASPPEVEVVDAATGQRVSDIFCQVRHDGDARYVLALNVNRDRWHRGARVRVRGASHAEEWSCLTGARHVPTLARDDGWLGIATDFAPAGERLYVVMSTRDASVPVKRAQIERHEEPLDGPFAYTLSEPNVCVLDRAAFRVDHGDWQPEKEILKVDRAVRERFGLPYRGGAMLQPWLVRGRGCEARGRVALRFELDVREVPAGPVELAMERPERFLVRVNGAELDTARDAGWWVDACFRRLPLPEGALRPGANAVELECAYDESMGLEALYLLGGFGVALSGTRAGLGRLPERLEAGDLTAQGLPFYSGAVRYRVESGARAAPGESLFVTLPGFSAACVKVADSRGGEQMIAWQPYEADVTDGLAAGGGLTLEAVLTRRNTFGPLHQVPPIAPAYGPDSFLTTGKRFSEGYMLYPAGLLEAPRLSWRVEA
ncbi:MAG: hypothetical protein IT208_02925 [Chthonomonadales bacterium]|nr:hypothetical protein [Chthonomonadales bacterium]